MMYKDTQEEVRLANGDRVEGLQAYHYVFDKY